MNGRLIKDRLVNHAVRQAFSEQLTGVTPSYVLMLELDPYQVDVNVHPAKHEVRFHQSRYVHDYILQALQSAMVQVPEMELALAHADNMSSAPESDVKKQTINTSAYEGLDVDPTSELAVSEKPISTSSASTKSAAYDQAHSSYRTPLKQVAHQPQIALPSKSRLQAYANLLESEPNDNVATSNKHMEVISKAGMAMPAIVAEKYWVIVNADSIRLLSISAVIKATVEQEIHEKLTQGLVGQPLLMPVAIPVDSSWEEIIDIRQQLLRKLGIELSIRLGQLIIKKVPPYLRDSQLASLIPELLQWIRFEEPSNDALAHWLATQTLNRYLAPAEAWLAFNRLENSAQQALYNQSHTLPWLEWMKESQSD